VTLFGKEGNLQNAIMIKEQNLSSYRSYDEHMMPKEFVLPRLVFYLFFLNISFIMSLRSVFNAMYNSGN